VPGVDFEPDTRPDQLVVAGVFARDGLTALRARLAEQAQEWNLSPRVTTVLALVATELVANVIVHAGGEGRVRVSLRDGRLFCQVSDHGGGMPNPYRAGWAPPNATDPHGRGLWVVRVFSDRLTIDSSPLGTTVTAVIDAAPAGV